MRLSLLLDERGQSLDDLVAKTRAAAEAGLTGVWMGDHLSWDALTTLAALGQAVPGIELGTSVVTTYPHHPLTLAARALTVQALTGNRLTLGIGASHQLLVEGHFGYSYDKPARHIREYVKVLQPALHGEAVVYEGQTLKANGTVAVPGATAPPLLIAAHGPHMLRIAGEQADGIQTAWTGPRTLAEYVVPSITKAAAGRPAPRILTGLPIAVTDNPGGVRDKVNNAYGMAAQLPSYRGVLEREGLTEVVDVCLIGDEATVEQGLRRLFDAGATDVAAGLVGSAADQRRTLDLLATLAK
ncbi:LLM class oxidoreductase [Flindersiella endophytica]